MRSRFGRKHSSMFLIQREVRDPILLNCVQDNGTVLACAYMFFSCLCALVLK